MNTRSIIIILFGLLPFAGISQCSASFTYQSNFTAGMFNGTVTPAPGPNANYYWWFSDQGNYATVEDPNYTFSQPGTYTVCFSVYDASSGCSDSVCQQVTVGGSCSADFTWNDSLGFMVFNGSSTLSTPATYVWDFGDGNFGGSNTEWHSYSSPGVYNVCLTVYDANQNFCDSTCHTVVVQNAGGCNADFTWIDTVGYCYFTSTTTAGSGAMYVWDFGDGGYAYSSNPSHQYMFAGNYTVCLTVYDSLQNFCDSVCHAVGVQSVGIEESAMQHSFNTSPNPADGSMQLMFIAPAPGEAKLTFFDASGRLAKEETVPVHNAGVVNSEINTMDMAEGIYLVKLEINGIVAWKKFALTHQ